MKRAPLLLLALATLACGSARSFHASEPVAEAPRAVTVAPGDADDEAFREKPPAAFARRKRTLIAPTEARLSNGVRVVMIERHDFPTIATVFVLGRGAYAAPPAVASVYANAITGTSRLYKSRDAWEYLRFVGANVAASAQPGAIYLHATSLSPFLRSALSRAAPMFAAPALTGDDLDRARAVLVADRQSAHDDAPVVAFELLYARLFPAPHPYGVPLGGATIADVQAARNGVVESFRDANLAAENVSVVAVGDFKPAQLIHVLEDVLGELPKKKTSAPSLEDTPAAPPRVVIVDRPGAAQSNVAIGWRGPAVGQRDHTALSLLAVATGAGLSSSLNVMIRKELGASYGVQMRVRGSRGSGSIDITAAIETPRTAEAVRGILAEAGRRGAAPLSPAELSVAKSRADYHVESGSNVGLAYMFASAIAEELPLSFVTARSERIEAISTEDIRGAAQRWLAPKIAQIVVVGDAARIAEDLRALDAGPVEVQRN
jgi:zinc protease